MRPAAKVAGLVLSFAAGAALLAIVGLRLAGYAPLVVLSGSMEPALPVGSVVFTHQVPAASVAPGQVITFERPGPTHELITHRVVAVRDGAFRTKGDANAAIDPWTIRYPAGQAWVEAFRIPAVGWPVGHVPAWPALSRGLLVVPFVLLFLLELGSTVRRRRVA
jgi:signal peptidase